MAGVTLENVIKRFGKTEVLHRINLEIGDNEFAVLVGPSGCGKSTTLRLVAGLESVSAGTIRIGSRVVNDVAPKDRDVAMVFQNYALYPHMSVFGNMSFGLKLQKVPRAEIQERVAGAAKILGLEEFLQRKPYELSGGQRQRVAMGRAIVREPSVFLFDEPLSNLDAKLRTQMRTEIKLLHHKVRATIIYVTHDQVEAMSLADRIVIMQDGYIEQIGSPLEVFEKPRNTFVAGFIGSPPMNLVPARIERRKGHLRLNVGEAFGVPLPEKSGAQVREEMDVTMGLRPEDLHADSRHLPEDWRVDSRVEVVEPLGSETLMHLDLKGVSFTAKIEGHRRIRRGDRLSLAMNLEHLHLFDAETGESIY